MANSVPQDDPGLCKHLRNCLHEIVTETNKKVLELVLMWGTPHRSPGQCFWDYLTLVKNLSSSKLRKAFTPQQRSRMEEGYGTNFDVSLLCLCIKYGCDGLAPPGHGRWVERANTLERNITSIKDYRNDLVHEGYTVTRQIFLEKVEELRRLLNDTLAKAAVVYNRDQQEIELKVREVNDELNSIRDRPLDTTANNILVSKLRECLSIEGKKELKTKYKKLATMRPSFNLMRKAITVSVNSIFVNLIITRDNGQYIDTERLLEYAGEEQSSSGKGSTILLVEGVAGAGKTTLTRKMLSDWASGFTKFDFAFWTECRDGGLRSIAQVFHFLMPETCMKFQNEHQIVTCIQENKLLFIVDGLDELSPSSEQVLIDIINIGKTVNITILCTTRPSRVQDFKRYVPDDFNILHAKISGIAEGDREDFVLNYNRALQEEGGSRDISGLLKYLKRKESRLQEHWKLPFNLVLVTILWILDSDAVNGMTTATELFVKTKELCQNRLEERLHGHEMARTLTAGEVRGKIDRFLKKLSEEAFISHCNGDIVLSRASVQRLSDFCSFLKLPRTEMLGSFLIYSASVTEGTLEKYSFPHKGLQDFFSAIHVKEVLDAEEIELDIPRILSSIKFILDDISVPSNTIQSILQKNNEMLKEAQIQSRSRSIKGVLEKTFQEALMYSLDHDQTPQMSLPKLQDILVHLTGLLFHKGKSLTERRASQLVKLLGESGIREGDQWLDFACSVKCDAAIIKHIVLSDTVTVTDGRVEAFASCQNNAETSVVRFDISGDPSDIPRLKELLVDLREKTWKTVLMLRHDFRFPKKGGSVLNDALRSLFRRKKLRVISFEGQLSYSAVAALPSCLHLLHLSVTDNEDIRSLLPVLTSLRKRLPRLERLALNLPTGLDLTLLHPLPKVKNVSLRFANVVEATAEKASQIAGALQPDGGFLRLIFPGVLKDTEAYTHLVECLAREGVRVRWAIFVSPPVGAASEEKLNKLTKGMLACSLVVKSDSIWRW